MYIALNDIYEQFNYSNILKFHEYNWLDPTKKIKSYFT